MEHHGKPMVFRPEHDLQMVVFAHLLSGVVHIDRIYCACLQNNVNVSLTWSGSCERKLGGSPVFGEVGEDMNHINIYPLVI